MKLFKSLLSRLTGRNKPKGHVVGTCFTRDFDSMAFQFRMGAGFAGDINRSHPASVEACLVDYSNPPLFYGIAVMADAASPNGIRTIATGDSSATDIYGVTVRPYPQQQATPDSGNYAPANFGNDAPPSVIAIDILRSGYIMVSLQGATPATKGCAVFVQTTVTSGNNIQGGFSAVTASGDIALPNPRTSFNGPADSNGIVELALHVG